MEKTSINILAITSLTIIISSGIYYIFSLSLLPWAISLLISLLAYLAMRKKGVIETEAKIKIGKIRYFLAFLLAVAIFLLISIWSATGEAIVSPWQKLSVYAWPMFILATFFLLIANNKVKGKSGIANFSLSLYYLAFLSLAAIIYKIGYGFDPFIHDAAMRYIEQYGSILPKTPYYIGQYGLQISLDRLLPISLETAGKWLLPLLAALSLPPTIRKFLESRGMDEKKSFLGAIMSLPLFAFLFISTTPQNLSFLFLLLTSFYLLSGYRRLPWLLALAALSIHPISGLPALATCLLFFILNTGWKSRKIMAVLIPIISASAILSAFLVSGARISWMGIGNFLSIFHPKTIFPNQESAWLDAAYFLINNIWIAIIAVIIWTIYHHARKKAGWPKFLLIASFSSFLPAIVCSLFLSFDSLISYEQQDYVLRLLLGTWAIILPMAIYGLTEISGLTIQAKSKGALIIIPIIMAVALYASYPRLDNFHHSRGYSLSESDLEAVNLIENSSNEEKYIVLSNQQSGVGALKEFGFARYLKDKSGKQIYFYSIPTGGKLYQYYLDMVYKYPDRQTMEKAMDEAGVNLGYLLISKYWWASDKIISEAKLEADSYFQTDNRQVTVFKFER